MPKLTFQSYGVRLAVETDDPYTLELIREYLPFGWEPASDGDVARCYSLGTEPYTGELEAGDSIVLYRDGTELFRIDDPSEALASLESYLQVDVAELAPDRVFIHAGVVGWRGKAIVLPGRSFSGKTTLVSALVRGGATYYSDEYAVFDRAGQVYPFPRPLWVREEGAARGSKHSVESLGGTAGSDPLSVGQVVLSTYDAGSRWQPLTLSPAEGLLGILENAVSVRRQPAIVIDTLQHVVELATVLKGTRGEAASTADVLLAYGSKEV